MRSAVLATILLLFAVSSAPASAAVPVTNGPIAYEAGAGDDADVAIANSDGTNATPALIASAGADRDPAISYDGKQLAFTSTRDGNEEIYRSALDGTAQTNLTHDPARDNDPDWAPDGRIAFTSDRAGGEHVFVMAADGSGVRQLTFGPGRDQQPSWSPDGREIAYASDASGSLDLYVVDVGSGAVRPLPATSAPETDPSWGPGNAIAFTRGAFGTQQVWRVGGDGTGLTQLTSGLADNHFPTWSPDGARIAYTAQSSVYTMDAASGQFVSYVGLGRDPRWGRLPQASAPPVAGETFTLTPAPGSVATVRPGETEASGMLAARVRDAVEVPAELAVDVKQGAATVKATTPQSDTGVTTMRLSGGLFAVRQGGASGTPVVTFRGNARAGCKGRRASISRRGQRAQVKGKGKGKTHYGNAGSPGTEWTVVETCAGALFTVQEGIIVVTPRHGRKPVRVHAGGRFLAR